MQNNIPPGYNLSGISLLARHGTRYPHRSDVLRYHANARYVQRNAQNPPEWLLKWEPVMKDEDNMQLGQAGWNEHQGIASRFSEMNPKLFKTPNKIWSSRKARSITSAKAFLSQLFDPNSSKRKGFYAYFEQNLTHVFEYGRIYTDCSHKTQKVIMKMIKT